MSATAVGTTPKKDDDGQPLLQVRNLAKYFPIRGGIFSRVRQQVRAVDQVSFQLDRGRTLGLVGESSCGKTTVGRTILRLIKPTAGNVVFDGQDIFKLSGREMRVLRRRMQIVFQDPYGSLDPRMTIGKTVGEPLSVHRLFRGRKKRDRVAELLSEVGLPSDAVNRYPHEFSGGQRQRIGIARALASDPAFIVCDEPTSALDVSVRAQMLNLLQDLQRQRKVAYLMISHDLRAVRHLSDEIAVMYLGRIIEFSAVDALFRHPSHPYTSVLIDAIPEPDPNRRKRRLVTARADVASLKHPPSGCPFHPRCPLYELKDKPEICRRSKPVLESLAEDRSHLTACHFAAETNTIAQANPH